MAEEAALRTLDQGGYSSSDDSEAEHTVETSDALHKASLRNPIPSEDDLKHILEHSQFNWFELIDQTVQLCSSEEEFEEAEETVVKSLDAFFVRVISLDLSDTQKQLLELSYRAFILDYEKRISSQRQAEALNGFIVTDSEKEDPDDFIDLDKDLSSPSAKSLLEKPIQSIRRRIRYVKAKKIGFCLERKFQSEGNYQ